MKENPRCVADRNVVLSNSSWDQKRCSEAQLWLLCSNNKYLTSGQPESGLSLTQFE